MYGLVTEIQLTTNRTPAFGYLLALQRICPTLGVCSTLMPFRGGKGLAEPSVDGLSLFGLFFLLVAKLLEYWNTLINHPEQNLYG
jgi:hypothetical protein